MSDLNITNYVCRRFGHFQPVHFFHVFTLRQSPVDFDFFWSNFFWSNFLLICQICFVGVFFSYFFGFSTRGGTK